MKNFNSDYIAFFPIGLTFMILGITGANNTAFLAIGIVFLILSFSLGSSDGEKSEDGQTDSKINGDDSSEQEKNTGTGN